jgi:hypothetical protein
LGYTATWSGLVLSPGAVLIVLTIPLVLKLMPVVQTRWIIAFGFTCLAASFFWSRTLTPDIDFETLVLFRSAQSMGLGFLFVPLTTIAFIRYPGGSMPTRRALPCSATWRFDWDFALDGGDNRTLAGAQRASGVPRVAV